VIDVFVGGLDLAALEFGGVDPEATGRPSYHPSVLLKLYVYGYLNRVQSSRRLEREAGRSKSCKKALKGPPDPFGDPANIDGYACGASKVEVFCQYQPDIAEGISRFSFTARTPGMLTALRIDDPPDIHRSVVHYQIDQRRLGHCSRSGLVIAHAQASN
jgi:hypothetical protein